MMMITARALCKRLCRRARTSSGGSSCKSKGKVGSHCLTCALSVTDTRWKMTSGGSQRSTLTAASMVENAETGGARHAARTTGGNRYECCFFQDSGDLSEATVLRAHAPSQGLCDNLTCALKLLSKLKRTETTWWTRSSKVCRTSQGSNSRLNERGLSRWTTTWR